MSVDLDVHRTSGLDDACRRSLHAVFDHAYEDADHDHLDRSIARLRHVAVARDNGELVAFSLGDVQVTDLPRLPAQPVALAGLICVVPWARRQGLFRRLADAPLAAAGVPPGTNRVLVAGRMAHPLSMSALRDAPGVLPRAGHTPDDWQRDVAGAVARLYDVNEFDAEHMTCRGRGRPIGYPVIDLDVPDDEWKPFQAVDRDRGDVLLAIAWRPAPPHGWT